MTSSYRVSDRLLQHRPYDDLSDTTDKKPDDKTDR